MSTKMFKIITLFMLLAMLAIPLSTVLAVATDIAGVSASVAENSTAAGTAVASGGTGPYTHMLLHVLYQARMTAHFPSPLVACLRSAPPRTSRTH